MGVFYEKSASPKQISYIIQLWNRQHGARATSLSQCVSLPISAYEAGGGLSARRAAEVIDKLKYGAWL